MNDELKQAIIDAVNADDLDKVRQLVGADGASTQSGPHTSNPPPPPKP